MALADSCLMLMDPAPRPWPLLPTAPNAPKSSDPPALPLMRNTCRLLPAAHGPPSLHGALLLPLMALDSSCLLPPALGPLAPRSPWVPAAHPWPFAMPTHAIPQGLPTAHGCRPATLSLPPSDVLCKQATPVALLSPSPPFSHTCVHVTPYRHTAKAFHLPDRLQAATLTNSCAAPLPDAPPPPLSPPTTAITVNPGWVATATTQPPPAAPPPPG